MCTEHFSTASLPCGSTSRPFPSDASRVYWYKGGDVTDTTARILIYKFNDSTTKYYNNDSSAKHSCSSDGVLSISDMQTGDQGTYACKISGSAVSFNFYVSLEILGEFLKKSNIYHILPGVQLFCFT